MTGRQVVRRSFGNIHNDITAQALSLKTVARKLLYRAARRYVAGPELCDAIGFARSLETSGLTGTVAYWNEVGEAPSSVQSAYLAAIDRSADVLRDTYVSIKAPALGLSADSTRALAQRCADRGVGLHFDSLAVEHQLPVFELIQRLAPTGAALGCTLPGRFRRSVDDAARAVELGVRVRVVKGQWGDPSGAVDPHSGFMAVVRQLAGRASHVSVATHDPALATEALDVLRARGTPADLELLLGLPGRSVRAVAARFVVPVRMYIPYGHAWLPYSISAARKNPRILFWILADALRGGTHIPGRRT